MAKGKRTKAAETSEGVNGGAKMQAPDGYVKQSTDILGFWNADDGPIHFVPLEVKMFDGKLEAAKPSIIIVGKLVDAMTLDEPGGEGEKTECKAGDVVGVWYKAGMSAIKNLAGVKVFMYQNGEIDTGKPNPMKVYEVLSKTKGQPLLVTQDARKKSLHVETSFAGARGDAKANAGAPPEQGADDIPF